MIMMTVFKGDPKPPHNSRPEEEVLDFYKTLDLILQFIPPNYMLLILDDFSARFEGKFSYHDEFNQNGRLLHEFTQQNNLIVGNNHFQKAHRTLWTWRFPRGDLAQIDF